MIRHLLGQRLRSEHERYFRKADHAAALQVEYGIDWAELIGQDSDDNPEATASPPRHVRAVQVVPTHEPAARRPDGEVRRREIQRLVQQALVSSRSLNEVAEYFEHSDVGLTPDETEVAVQVCVAASMVTADMSTRYARLRERDEDTPGAVSERRRLRRTLRRIRRGLPDMTRSQPATNDRRAETPPVVTLTTPEVQEESQWSDVEPDSDPPPRMARFRPVQHRDDIRTQQIVTIVLSSSDEETSEPRAQSSTPALSRSVATGLDVPELLDRSPPYRPVCEDITPVDSE